MAIGARAHARLGETTLCLGLLDQAHVELDRHVPNADAGWLAVFDHAALDGHRGSCFLDLGLPDRAVASLRDQDTATESRFVRNRMIWQLDRVEAHLHLGEVREACHELLATLTMPGVGSITPRVLRRFRTIDLRLRDMAAVGVVAEALDRLRELTVVNA